VGNGNGRVCLITVVGSDGKGGETIGTMKAHVQDMLMHRRRTKVRRYGYKLRHNTLPPETALECIGRLITLTRANSPSGNE